MAWANKNTLIVGNDGGVWSTRTGGNKWINNNGNLTITQFYKGSASPDSSLLLGGSQDNGTELHSGNPEWSFVFGGDGAANAISFSRPTTDWAVSFQGLNI